LNPPTPPAAKNAAAQAFTKGAFFGFKSHLDIIYSYTNPILIWLLVW
jgi:hypothetical protein